MSQTPTAAEQYQNLVTQEAGLLTSKARLLEQLETTNAQLTAVRAALQGAQAVVLPLEHRQRRGAAISLGRQVQPRSWPCHR